jgi:hypothetical protein
MQLDRSPDGTLPPEPVVQSLVDTYFVHVHNQPYTYFSEKSFRQKLKNGLLPKCLILAVLASAIRFSDHPYYQGRALEMIELYAKDAWLSVLHDHLAVEEVPNIHVVQTVNLLGVVNFTGMSPTGRSKHVRSCRMHSRSDQSRMVENRGCRPHLTGPAIDGRAK